MGDAVEAGVPLLVRLDDVPRRDVGVGVDEHLVLGAREVDEPAPRLDVHAAQLPAARRVVQSRLEASLLLLVADREPVLEEHDAVLDEHPLELRALAQEPAVLVGGAEAHHLLDAGAVVPAAVEENDLAGGGKLGDVALEVPLRLLALGRRRQGRDPAVARVEPLLDALDRAALARRVPALEDDGDARARLADPVEHQRELDLQPLQLPLVDRARNARRMCPPTVGFASYGEAISACGAPSNRIGTRASGCRGRVPILRGWNGGSRRCSSSTSSARRSSSRAPIPRSFARGWHGSSTRSRTASRRTAASSRSSRATRSWRRSAFRSPTRTIPSGPSGPRSRSSTPSVSSSSRSASAWSRARSSPTRPRPRSPPGWRSTRPRGCSRRPRPGQILLGPAVERLTRDTVVTTPLGAQEARGFPAGVEAWKLVSVSDDVGRRLVSSVPLVGREEELELLHNTLARAVRDRRAHLVTVYGAAGVGKSRLAREFVDGVERSTILAGRCLPYGEGVTYWAIAEMVKIAAGITDDDSVDAAAEKLRLCCGDEAVADLLALAAGVLDAVGGERSSSEIAWAAQAWATELADLQPLVLVFEDIHWAEGPMLDLIEHLAGGVRDVPLLLVCLARSDLLDERPKWGGGNVRATAIELEPLPRRGEREARRGPGEQRVGRAHGRAAGGGARDDRGESALHRGDRADAARVGRRARGHSPHGAGDDCRPDRPATRLGTHGAAAGCRCRAGVLVGRSGRARRYRGRRRWAPRARRTGLPRS